VGDRGKPRYIFIYFDIEGGDAGRYLVGVSWVAGLTTRGRLVAVEDPEMAMPMALPGYRLLEMASVRRWC
jgi:hypothetical protein